MLQTTRVIQQSFKKLLSLTEVHKKAAMIIVGACLLLIAGVLVFLSFSKDGDRSIPTSQLGFDTIVPTGKSIEQLGGWQRVSPEETAPVYAYTDTVEGVSITVSQQDIPNSFGTNTNSKVAELAKNFNATNTLNVGGLTVYIGTSAKGPQSLIFTKDKTLVLIKSDEEISGSAWTAYIESLQ